MLRHGAGHWSISGFRSEWILHTTPRLQANSAYRRLDWCGGWKRDDLLDAGCEEVYRDPADLIDQFESSLFKRFVRAQKVRKRVWATASVLQSSESLKKEIAS